MEHLLISASIAGVPCLDIEFSDKTCETDRELFGDPDDEEACWDFYRSMNRKIRQLLMDYERQKFDYRKVKL